MFQCVEAKGEGISVGDHHESEMTPCLWAQGGRSFSWNMGNYGEGTLGGPKMRPEEVRPVKPHHTAT